VAACLVAHFAAPDGTTAAEEMVGAGDTVSMFHHSGLALSKAGLTTSINRSRSKSSLSASPSAPTGQKGTKAGHLAS
jgi:hypothetical protein